MAEEQPSFHGRRAESNKKRPTRFVVPFVCFVGFIFATGSSARRRAAAARARKSSRCSSMANASLSIQCRHRVSESRLRNLGICKRTQVVILFTKKDTFFESSGQANCWPTNDLRLERQKTSSSIDNVEKSAGNFHEESASRFCRDLVSSKRFVRLI